MSKLTIWVVLLLFLSIGLYSQQIPMTLSVHATGTDISGILGAELQLNRMSISEGWQPMINGVNSLVTTFTFYGKSWQQSCWYFSSGYSTKGYPYYDGTYTYNLYYDKNDIKFSPATYFMIGYKSVIYEISNRLNAKGGLGITLSEYGTSFSFQLSVSFIILKSKL